MALIVIIAGCTFFGGHDELTIDREKISCNKLRFDGYYIVDDKKDETVSTYILYRNGIIFYVMSINRKEIPELEKKMINMNLDMTEFHRYHWGVFQIEGDSIKYEKWAAYDGYKPAFLHSGYILNDTTFVITSVSSDSKIFDKPRYTKTNTVYRFKQLPLKPDSTNNFIN